MRVLPRFKPFSNQMLERISAGWSNGLLTIYSVDRPVMSLSVDDARDLIDALSKFVAVSE